jgi:serine/threonine-protein kinase
MQHPFHLMPDMMVGPFRIQARLGAGGFGAVFRVEYGGEQYALKFAVHGPDSEDLNRTDARARRELACLLLIEHPHVVRVWAHGRWPHPRNGYHYIVMDYVEGLTLTEWVRQTRPPLRQVLRLFDTLALTLEALHAKDIHHRDLKGSNILVRARDGEPVLVDFGAGELTEVASPLTEGPLPPGTPHLRTPEALRFHREQYADPTAHYPFQPTDDLYALGATLYEALTGAPPFPPTLPREVLTSLIEREMPPSPAALNPQVPPALGALVLRLLAKRPEERPPSGQVLHELLQALLHDGSPTLELPLSPGAHAATTEGMGGLAVMSSADVPEGPLPGLAEWGGTRTSSGSISLSEGSAPTELAERASPGSPRRWRRRWVAGAAVLVLLAVLAAALSPNPTAPTQEELPPSIAWGFPPTPLLPDVGSDPLALFSPDEGPQVLAEAPPSSPLQKEKGPLMRTKPPAKNPVAKPEKPRSQGTGTVRPIASAVAACVLAGSCATSDSAVRSVPLPREQCPPNAVEAMHKEFGISTQKYPRMSDYFAMPGSADDLTLDDNNNAPVSITEGRYEVRLYEHVGKRNLGIPKKAALVGDFFIRDRLYARFFEVRMPDGRRLPFCAELRNPDSPFDRGVPYQPDTQPGAVRVPSVVYVWSRQDTH